MRDLGHFLRHPVTQWRTGSPVSQAMTLVVGLAGVAACLVVSMVEYALMPLTAYFVWILAGMLLLRFRQLLLLTASVVVAALTAMAFDPPLTPTRVTAVVAMLCGASLVLFAASKQHSGLPAPMSEALLADLRRRLQFQGTIPALPAGWSSHASLVAADGAGYGGDFVVAHLDTRDRLEVILVDVTGKGVHAASRALQFGGALGGLIGSIEQPRLFEAANSFLLRQACENTFATAVHVEVDLRTGDYALTSAGHPPPLCWRPDLRRWETEETVGTALGIVPDLAVRTSRGRLEPGAALMLYTDGVVETRRTDLDEGVTWLAETAALATLDGFAGAPDRIIDQVETSDDDRALLILERHPVRIATTAALAAPERALA